MPEAAIGRVVQVDASGKLLSPRIGSLLKPASRINNIDWVRYIPDFTFVVVLTPVHAASKSVGETVVLATTLQVHG